MKWRRLSLAGERTPNPPEMIKKARLACLPGKSLILRGTDRQYLSNSHPKKDQRLHQRDVCTIYGVFLHYSNLFLYFCEPDFEEGVLKPLRQFDIHIFKLADGTHEYRFEIDDSFFESFQNELVRRGNLMVDVSLHKSENMIEASFRIEGTIELVCDRSLELFDHPVVSSRKMIYKLGEEDTELSDELVMVRKDRQTINVSSLIFEFISLEIPMKKLHPRFEDELTEESGIVYTSAGHHTGEEHKVTDPRWETLKKLKHKM